MIMDAGTVYWVTGLSGAGKTTVGSKLYSTLKEKKSNVVMLDGDILRNVFQMFDYSTGGEKISCIPVFEALQDAERAGDRCSHMHDIHV
jgi:signal recognition particle GTPase